MTATNNVKQTKRARRVRVARPVKETRRERHYRLLAKYEARSPFYNFVKSLHGVIADERSDEYKTWALTHRTPSLLGPVMQVKCDLGHVCQRLGNTWTCYDCRFIHIDL